MGKIPAVIFLALCALGCSPKPMTELAISPAFTEAEQEAAIEEAERWFERVPESRVPVFIGTGKHGSIIPGSSRSKSHPCDGTFLGHTALPVGGGPVVGICVRGDDLELFRKAVRHELGHAIARSRDHIGRGNTMSGDVDGMADNITDSDVAYAGY